MEQRLAASIFELYSKAYLTVTSNKLHTESYFCTLRALIREVYSDVKHTADWLKDARKQIAKNTEAGGPKLRSSFNLEEFYSRVSLYAYENPCEVYRYFKKPNDRNDITEKIVKHAKSASSDSHKEAVRDLGFMDESCDEEEKEPCEVHLADIAASARGVFRGRLYI